ncbi:MAG: SDR family NAD(P)-dependent oxidoreductase, partial [Pseudomonadota bacterium]
MGRVANKIALVTGAAQGLGEAIAHKLADEGAIVIATDINEAGAAETAAAINARFEGQAHSLKHDVTSLDEWTAAVELAERLGGLNILVNNAGIGSIGNVVDETLERWR